MLPNGEFFEFSLNNNIGVKTSKLRFVFLITLTLIIIKTLLFMFLNNQKIKTTIYSFRWNRKSKRLGKAVNGFHAMKIFDLNISWSNADLLSSELSTYLGGVILKWRLSLSYQEFIILCIRENFYDDVTYSGITSIEPFNLDYDLSMNILRDSFKTVVL